MKNILCTVFIAGLVLGCGQQCLAADYFPIGFFKKNLDACVIVQGQKRNACKKGGKLYTGDRIESDMSDEALFASVEWLDKDKASIVRDGEGYTLRYEGSTKMRSLGSLALETFLSSLSLFSQGYFKTVYTVSRLGPPGCPDPAAVMLPGPRASVFKDQAFRFRWCNSDAARLRIQRKNGEELATIEVAGQETCSVDPETLAWPEEEKLVWILSAKAGKKLFRGELSLLPEELGVTMNEVFACIDGSESVPEAQKAMQKLQFVHSMQLFHKIDAVDLSWLFVELLQRYENALAGHPDADHLKTLYEPFTFVSCE